MKRILIGAMLFLSGALAGGFFPVSQVNAQELLGNMGAFLGIEQGYSRAFINGDADRLEKSWHEKYLGWHVGEDLPWDKEFAYETVDLWIEDHGGTLSQPMLEPIATRVLDNAAVVHYLLEYIVEDDEGAKTHRKVRVSHFWVKEGGKWQLLGEAMAGEE